MEKRVSIRDIAEMHLSQQLERKKALLLNLELDACARQGGLCRARHNEPYDEIDVMPRYVQYS